MLTMLLTPETREEELKEILKPEKMTQPMREKVMKAVS